jgi:hypothetical protein
MMITNALMLLMLIAMMLQRLLTNLSEFKRQSCDKA